MHQPFRAPVESEPESTRRALLRLQRGVHRRLQAEVRAFTGGNSPAIERYYREYTREFKRYQSVSSYGELHQTLLDSDLVLIGDYHTLRQSQQAALRLLQRAAADSRPACLGVEMILAEHQECLDSYMAGTLSDGDFLRAVQYHRTWNFDWENYRPLFAEARRLGVRVLGINHPARGPRSRIQERDGRIAESLGAILQARPEARLLVLIGDLHLASNHLPRALDRRLGLLGLQPRRLLVYQNSDTLYWSLAERGSEVETQVVRLGRGRYCVMEVPPYVKLQSYLSWEQALERCGDGAGRPDDWPEPSCANVLAHLVAQMCQFLELPLVEAGCEVFTSLDESFFEALHAASVLGEERVRQIHLNAFANRSCCVPELDLVYLPYFSVNHAAEEAMHVVMAKLDGAMRAERDAYEDFYAHVLWAGLGYVGSKIVNSRRRASTEADFRNFLQVASRRLHDPELAFRKLVARFVVQHKDHEGARRTGRRGRLKQIYDQEIEVRIEVTLALGYMLGEAIAVALRAGKLGRPWLRDLVLSPLAPTPSERYFSLIDEIEKLGAI